MYDYENRPQLPRRLGRIANRIRFLVSEIIRRELQDPRIGFITVLAVEPTVDLKEAKVYVSVLGSRSDRSKAQHALESARGFIQRQVGRNLSTRNTPVLRFIFDDSQDKVSRIEALLRQTKSGDLREETMAKKPPKKSDRPDSTKPDKPGAKKGGGKGKAYDEDEELEDLDLDESEEDLGLEEEEGFDEPLEGDEEFDEDEIDEDVDEDYEDEDYEEEEEEEEEEDEDYEDIEEEEDYEDVDEEEDEEYDEDYDEIDDYEEEDTED